MEDEEAVVTKRPQRGCGTTPRGLVGKMRRMARGGFQGGMRRHGHPGGAVVGGGDELSWGPGVGGGDLGAGGGDLGASAPRS